ncbi:MAG: hypothetical protein H6608_11095 [Flavobacteriales bacterium]|nr:hypothetical protein [Bacteroidota bacterium]MCB9241672.1 hypothetical protein [Flavobacteriales bacterium]
MGIEHLGLHPRHIGLTSLTVALLIILAPTLKGQVSYTITVDTSANDNSQNLDSGNVVVSADAMDVLYMGVFNPISIAIPGIASSELFVELEGVKGVIQHDTGISYRIKVWDRGTAIFRIYRVLNDSSRIILGTRSFRVRPIPKPEVHWGAIENNGIPVPKAALLAQMQVFASLGSGFVLEGVSYQISEYQFVLDLRQKDSVISKKVYGNMIDRQIKDMVQQCESGDRVIIDMIRAKGPDGIRSLSPIILEVQ